MTKKTETPKPMWNPRDNFPIDLETASFESVLGALLALVEHQQRFILGSAEQATIAGNHQRAVFATPSVYLPKILQSAHLHESRGLQRNRGRTHAELIDEVVSKLPDNLPTFLPMTCRWQAYRSFRGVRQHMRDSWTEWKIQFGIWKAEQTALGAEDIEDPDDHDGEGEGGAPLEAVG